MTKREERMILWLVGLNAVFLFVAPIGGATLIQAVIGLWGHR